MTIKYAKLNEGVQSHADMHRYRYYGRPKPESSFEKEPQIPDKKAASAQTGRTGEIRQRKQ